MRRLTGKLHSMGLRGESINSHSITLKFEIQGKCFIEFLHSFSCGFFFFFFFFLFISLSFPRPSFARLLARRSPMFVRPTAKRSHASTQCTASHATTKGRVPRKILCMGRDAPFPSPMTGGLGSLSFQAPMPAPHSDDFPPACRHHRSISKDTSESHKPVRIPRRRYDCWLPPQSWGFPPPSLRGKSCGSATPRLVLPAVWQSVLLQPGTLKYLPAPPLAMASPATGRPSVCGN